MIHPMPTSPTHPALEPDHPGGLRSPQKKAIDEMERNKKTTLLFLLLALPHVCASSESNCPSQPDKNLTCFTDYNKNISCEWNSTFVTDSADTECTIHAKFEYKSTRRHYKDSSSCKLEPVDVSRPKQMRCNLFFKHKHNFLSFYEYTMNLVCNPGKQILSISYKPSCHIKLKSPPKPEIKPDDNFTVVSWLPEVTKNPYIEVYRSHLQWKRASQSWSDPFVQREGNEFKDRKWECSVKLDKDQLIQNETYEARVRVQPSDEGFSSTWSEWSPTVSWVSLIGNQQPTTKPPPPSPTSPPSDVPLSVLGTVAFAVAFALLIVLVKTDKTTWIYKVKRIGNPHIPNPGKFLRKTNFETWLSPYYQSGSSLSKTVDIASWELTSTLDAAEPCGSKATLQEKMRIETSSGSTSSSSSKHVYSAVRPSLLPVSSLTAGNLEPCVADSPYGPVACQAESKNAEQDRDEGKGKEAEILQLLSKSSNNSETLLVVSDYERVEKPQVERHRLQSLDSGVCSGEEVSQESLEADSINVTDCHDAEPEGNEDKEGGRAKEVDFQKLFGGSGGIYDKGSIQVCSGYEQVQKLQTDSPELPSLDSGISSGGEEQLSQEESLEDIDKTTESTSLLFPPPPLSPSCALACSSPSFTPSPFNFSGACLSPAVRPLPVHLLERMSLMSTCRSVEPSGDGYMPVRQQQS